MKLPAIDLWYLGLHIRTNYCLQDWLYGRLLIALNNGERAAGIYLLYLEQHAKNFKDAIT